MLEAEPSIFVEHVYNPFLVCYSRIETALIKFYQ